MTDISLQEILQHSDPIESPPDDQVQLEMSAWRSTFTIATLSGLTTVSSMTTGLLVVALPRMALDLSLPEQLLLWYEFLQSNAIFVAYLRLC